MADSVRLVVPTSGEQHIGQVTQIDQAHQTITNWACCRYHRGRGRSDSFGREHLYGRIVAITEDARTHVARSVNAAMVHAYWHIGREIVEVEQGGTQRAAYGEQIIDGLSARLRARFGQGFGVRSLRRMRQFYLTYARAGTPSGIPAV